MHEIFDQFKQQLPDIDPAETQEWLDSLDGVVTEAGPERARFIIYKLLKRARQLQVGLPPLVQTRYVNTISTEQEPNFPGDDSEFCKRDMATIDLGFDLPADGIGPSFKSADGTESVVDHCALIEPDVANGIAAVLWPEFGTAAGHFILGASVPWRERSAVYDLTIRPLFPEEAATCAGKSLPPLIGP